jgi:hypothetical protein
MRNVIILVAFGGLAEAILVGVTHGIGPTRTYNEEKAVAAKVINEIDNNRRRTPICVAWLKGLRKTK